MVVEIVVALICACALTYPVLYKRYISRTRLSEYNQYATGKSTNKTATPHHSHSKSHTASHHDPTSVDLETGNSLHPSEEGSAYKMEPVEAISRTR